MKGKVKGIYDESGKVYARGTTKALNKIYEKIVKAYPNKVIYMGDVDKNKKLVGSDRFVSFIHN